MQIISRIAVDLASPGVTPRIYGKQDDSGSRAVEIALYNGGVAFDVPADAILSIRAQCPGGLVRYDTLADGSAACTAIGNTVTAQLVAQIFAVEGTVSAELHITDSTSGVSTWDFLIVVQKSNSGDAAMPSDYVSELQAAASQAAASAQAAKDAADSLNLSTLMRYEDYDPDGSVKAAGGISAFVNSKENFSLSVEYGTFFVVQCGSIVFVTAELNNLPSNTGNFFVTGLPTHAGGFGLECAVSTFADISTWSSVMMICEGLNYWNILYRRSSYDAESLRISFSYPTL